MQTCVRACVRGHVIKRLGRHGVLALVDAQGVLSGSVVPRSFRPLAMARALGTVLGPFFLDAPQRAGP